MRPSVGWRHERLPHHIGPSWLRAGCSYDGLWRFLGPSVGGFPTAVDMRSVVPSTRLILPGVL